jgi:DNA-binding LytR/AlgR family response regulator
MKDIDGEFYEKENGQMLRVAVCDDESNALEIISNKIKNEFQKQQTEVNVDIYSCGTRLRHQIFCGQKYDAIFLDIQMPDIDGIELAKHFRETTPNSLIIFISNNEASVFRSISAGPFRFIRKIHFSRELPEAISAIIKHNSKNSDSFIVLETNKLSLHLIPYTIMYIECYDKTLHIITEYEQIKVTYKLSSLEKLLEGYGFIRIHKSYLVNYRYIYSIDKQTVELDNHSILPLSRPRLKEVKSEYRRLTL